MQRINFFETSHSAHSSPQQSSIFFSPRRLSLANTMSPKIEATRKVNSRKGTQSGFAQLSNYRLVKVQPDTPKLQQPSTRGQIGRQAAKGSVQSGTYEYPDIGSPFGVLRSDTNGYFALKLGTKSLRQIQQIGAEITQTIELDQQHQGQGSEESARESSKKRSQPKVEKNLPLRLDTGMDLASELAQNKFFQRYLVEREQQLKILNINLSKGIFANSPLKTKFSIQQQLKINQYSSVEVETPEFKKGDIGPTKQLAIVTELDNEHQVANTYGREVKCEAEFRKTEEAKGICSSISTKIIPSSLLIHEPSPKAHNNSVTFCRLSKPKVAVRLKMKSLDRYYPKRDHLFSGIKLKLGSKF